MAVVCCRGYVSMVFEVHYLCRHNPKIRHPKLMPTIIVQYQTTMDSLLGFVTLHICVLHFL